MHARPLQTRSQAISSFVGVQTPIGVDIFIDVLTKRVGWEESLRVLRLTRKAHETPDTCRAVTTVAMLKAVFQA